MIVLLHLSLTALERVDEWSGRGPEWARTRRDVVFCSVVVTTSVITSLRDDALTERTMVTKIIFSRSDTAQKPYYFGSKNPHVRAVFTTALLGFASVCSTRASAASHRQLNQRLSA